MGKSQFRQVMILPIRQSFRDGSELTIERLCFHLSIHAIVQCVAACVSMYFNKV